MEITQQELAYLKLLAKQYPTIQAAATEIINLNAILNLPKGTEHFVSDIHGEYEAFLHVLRNGSGSIKRKIEEIFADTLPARENRRALETSCLPSPKPTLDFSTTRGNPTAHNPERWRDRDKRDFGQDRGGIAANATATTVARESRLARQRASTAVRKLLPFLAIERKKPRRFGLGFLL